MVENSTLDADVAAARSAPAPADVMPTAAAAMEPAAAPPAATPGQAAGRRVRARHRVALVLILLFHGALAYWMAVLRGPYEPYFYDEKFNMENVVQIITTHWIEPANGWYSLLSYLPQALVGVAMDELHQHTGNEFFRAIDPNAQPPLFATYHLFMAARLVGIFYGSLSLLLVFWLGARLFSPATGVLAALALAVSPWMIRTSVEFKPDSLLMLTTLLATLFLVRFLEQPSLRRYLWVGFGLGLTTTAKLDGSFIGPLVALVGITGALLVEPRDPRAAVKRILLWGSTAAALAAAVFFATTPYFKLMLFYLGRIERFYGQRAGESTPKDVVVQALTDMPTAVFLGPVIWALTLLGLVVVLVRLFERGIPPALKFSRLLLVLYPLTAGTVLAFTMRYYKQNNLVQFLPCFALLAALGLTTLGSFSERLPRWFGRSLATLALLAFTAQAGWLALSFSFEENVPWDWQVLTEQLRLYAKLESPRVVIYEGTYETLPIYRFGRKDGAALWPSVRWLDDAGTVPRHRLDLADAVALRKDLGGPQRNALINTLAAAVPADAIVQIDPQPLRMRGHGFTVIFHQWRFRDDGVGELQCKSSDDPAVFLCRLPDDFLAGEVAAVHFAFPTKKLGVADILIGGEEGEKVEALTTADLGEGKGWEAMSERFVVPGPKAEILLRFEKPIEGPLSDTVPVSLSRWIAPPDVKLELPRPVKRPPPALPADPSAPPADPTAPPAEPSAPPAPPAAAEPPAPSAPAAEGAPPPPLPAGGG